MTSSSSTSRALLAEQTLLDGHFQPDMAVLIDGGRITGVQPVSALTPEMAV